MKPISNRQIATSMIMRSTALSSCEASMLLDILLDVVREEVLGVEATRRWARDDRTGDGAWDGRGDGPGRGR